MHAYALYNISVPCIFAETLIVCSKCDAVGTFPASIDHVLVKNDKISYLSSRSRNNTDTARYLSSRFGRAYNNSTPQNTSKYYFLFPFR